MKIPISTKLITVTILTVVASTASITLISSEYFEKKAAEQIDISNLESAAGKAREINGILANFIDKSKAIGLVLLRNSAITANNSSVTGDSKNTELNDELIFSFLKTKTSLQSKS